MVKDKYVVMIPVRGGSKSIHLKNIKPILGRPLVYWSIDAALSSKKIDKIYIATDSEEIKQCIKSHEKYGKDSRLIIYDRDPFNASDTSTTEDIQLEFSKKFDYKNLVFIQATNPLITGLDIDSAIREYEHGKFDSLLSTVIQKRFYWNFNSDGSISEIGHDIRKRPRRQDWNGVLAENGSIYIISKENLEKGKCRLYGRIGTYIMPEYSYYEIDEEYDWKIIEEIMRYRLKK